MSLDEFRAENRFQFPVGERGGIEPGESVRVFPQNCRPYPICSDDTVEKLAWRHGTTVPQLTALNPSLGNDPDAQLKERVGYNVMLPALPPDHGTLDEQPAPKPLKYNEKLIHPVEEGDTLESVAEDYCMTVKQVRMLNRNLYPVGERGQAHLIAGQVLVVLRGA
jgi:LysM repeat protein